jgi:chromosome partitioning protein
MKTIVIASRKGGTGKTSICFNLGAAYAITGRRVCLVDLDSQANLSTLCRADPCTLEDFKAGKTVNLSAHLSILPASKAFHVLENEINKLPSRNGYIKEKIVSHLGGFDYVIIDTPAGLSVINTSAFFAADMIHIIVNPDAFSLAGLMEMREIIAQVKAKKPSLVYRVVLNAAFKGRRITDATLDALKDEPGYTGVLIPNRQHIIDCNALRKPAIDMSDVLEPFQKLAGEL